MRRAVLAVVCAVAVAASAAPAHAQATNGQLAVVLRDRIMAVNPDGTGLRQLYKPASGGEISHPAWSPDGTRIAFSYQDKITVLDIAGKAATSLTKPGIGERDLNPTWLRNGTSIGFRRVAPLSQQRWRVDATTGREAQLGEIDLGTTELAFWPALDRWAMRIGPLLSLSNGEGFYLRPSATGPLAFSRDGQSLAYVDTGDFAERGFDRGLSVIGDVWGAAPQNRVTPLSATAISWAPDNQTLAFVADGVVRTVPAAKDATPVTVGAFTDATAVDWQPCLGAATAIGCRSVLAPVCSSTAVQVTTQTDQAVELPPAPCTDPEQRPLQLVRVKDGDNGTLSGTTYTPRGGFTGQDSVTYRMSNGTAESELVRVTIFVVPRPAAAGPPPSANPPSAAAAAPFLSLRVKPRLDRKRSTLARLACDQACTFTVRLEGTLRAKGKTVKGRTVTRTLDPGRVLAVRLQLPAKPKGKLKRVWISGTVRGGAGAARPVKLRVALPR